MSEKRFVPACSSARSIAAASSAARSYGCRNRRATSAAQSASCQRPRGTEAIASRKAACAADVHPTCSPPPAVSSPRSRTTDVGRSPPYDGTGTEPTWHSTASIATPSAASSGVGGTAEAGEDLSPLGQVPVAEGVADGDRPRRPRAAAQHLVAAAEVRIGILAVREGLEAGVGLEVARRPLPHVADHLVAAEEAPPARVGADGGRCERLLVEVRVVVGRGQVAPRVAARHALLQIPRRGLLPLGLGRQP